MENLSDLVHRLSLQKEDIAKQQQQPAAEGEEEWNAVDAIRKARGMPPANATALDEIESLSAVLANVPKLLAHPELLPCIIELAFNNGNAKALVIMFNLAKDASTHRTMFLFPGYVRAAMQQVQHPNQFARRVAFSILAALVTYTYDNKLDFILEGFAVEIASRFAPSADFNERGMAYELLDLCVNEVKLQHQREVITTGPVDPEYLMLLEQLYYQPGVLHFLMQKPHYKTNFNILFRMTGSRTIAAELWATPGFVSLIATILPPNANRVHYSNQATQALKQYVLIRPVQALHDPELVDVLIRTAENSPEERVAQCASYALMLWQFDLGVAYRAQPGKPASIYNMSTPSLVSFWRLVPKLWAMASSTTPTMRAKPPHEQSALARLPTEMYWLVRDMLCVPPEWTKLKES